MHLLSHSFHSDALFIRKEYEYLVRGIRAGVGEKIELIPTEKSKHWSTWRRQDRLWSCPLNGATVVRVLGLEICQGHVDFLIRDLIALRVGPFSQTLE
jgi:hypothetical protein